MSSRKELTARIADGMRDVIADAVLTNERIARGFGINVVDLQTLSVLMRAETALTPGEIARRTGLPTSTVTRVLDRLEAQHFVARTPDPEDRRRVVVETRPDGFARHTGENPYAGILEDLARLHERFTVPELEVVARYLEAMAALGDD